jgi:methylglutaconyl-CoA hydratase
LVFTARRLGHEEAADMGLVDFCVGEDAAMERCLELAREILPQGPLAVRLAKEAIDRGMQVDLDTGMAVERACYAQVLSTQDRLEGLQAFKEKRKPVYQGH